MKVRQAELTDVKRIQEICIKGQYDTYGEYESKEYLDKAVEEFYNSQRLENEIKYADEYGTWYVAEDDENSVIGVLIGGKKDDQVSEIYALYVDTERKGQGTGGALVNYFKEVSSKVGSKGLWVSVDSKNNLAIGFYEAIGFEYKFTREKYFNEEESASKTYRMYQDL